MGKIPPTGTRQKCVVCGKPFQAPKAPRPRTTCSLICQSEARRRAGRQGGFRKARQKSPGYFSSSNLADVPAIADEVHRALQQGEELTPTQHEETQQAIAAAKRQIRLQHGVPAVPGSLE